jgi:uncharacterized protein (TIGR02266 family)
MEEDMSSASAAAVAGPEAQEARFRREQRGHQRVDLEAVVTLESDHNFYTGLTRDISAGGLFVATHALRPVGARLRVRFSLPGASAPIEADAEVRWVRDSRFSTLPPGMGLRFVNVSGAALLAVSRFVQQRDTIFYDD